MREYHSIGAAVAAAMEGNARRAAELAAEAQAPARRERHEARQQLRGTEG